MAVTPAQAKALIPAANTSICYKVIQLFIRLPTFIYLLVSEMKNSDGTWSDSFKAALGLTVGGLGIPGNVTASDGTYSTYVRITWSAVTSAQSYTVWRSTTNDSTVATQIGSPPSLTLDDGTVTVGQRYFYFVKAVNAGGVSLFSAGDAGNAGAAAIPTSTARHFDDTGTWSVPTGVTSVRVDTYGGGGEGGGGAQSIGSTGWVAYGGGGGGAGGHTIKLLQVVSPGQTLTITIGKSVSGENQFLQANVAASGGSGQFTSVVNTTTLGDLGVAYGGGGGGGGRGGTGGTAGTAGSGSETVNAGIAGTIGTGGAGGTATYGAGGAGGGTGTAGTRGSSGHVIITPGA